MSRGFFSYINSLLYFLIAIFKIIKRMKNKHQLGKVLLKAEILQETDFKDYSIPQFK